jgi:Cu+-exporting ATPase
MQEIKKIKITGMTCSMCVRTIEKKLNKLEGVYKININLTSETASVEFDNNKVSINDIIQNIEDVGYGAKIDVESEFPVKKNALIFPIVSLVISILMMLSMNFDYVHHKFYYFYPIITFLILLFLSKDIFINAYKNIKNYNLNMDVMYATGIFVSFASSLLGTFYHIDYEYYDTAIMLAAFLRIGKFIENNAKKNTNLVLNKLKKMIPERVLKKVNDQFVETDLKLVNKDDYIKILPGNIIPVDGFVVEGNSVVNEASITGEPFDKSKTVNDYVYAGSINQNGYLIVKVDKIGEKSIIGEIIEILENAQIGKTQYHKLVDKISKIFLPIVSLIAIFSFIINFLVLNNSLAFSLSSAISVLVIACPCALALATPTAISVGFGIAAKYGFLIKNIETVERYVDIDTLIFDKTGTLTYGIPNVEKLYIVKGSHENLLQIAYNLEINSNHTFASAIIEQAQKHSSNNQLPISEFHEIPGKGTNAIVDDKKYYIGSFNYLLENEIYLNSEQKLLYQNIIEQGGSPVFLFTDKELLAFFDIRDKIKEEASEIIEYFKSKEKAIYILSGDNKKTVETIARKLNVCNYYGELLPNDKKKLIEKLNQEGKNTMFIGDGINDILALTEAKLGIAVSNSTDIAKEAGDIILLNKSLKSLILLDKLLNRIFFQIKINLFWAMIYNIILIPIASGVFYNYIRITISPGISALFMAISSISIVLFSLSLNKFRGDVL